MLVELSVKRLVAEPGRLRPTENNLDIFPASVDTADVADHFRAAFLYHSVGEVASVQGFVTPVMTSSTTHQNVFHNGMKPESGHETSIEHGSGNSRFPIHSCVKVNGLKI